MLPTRSNYSSNINTVTTTTTPQQQHVPLPKFESLHDSFFALQRSISNVGNDKNEEEIEASRDHTSAHTAIHHSTLTAPAPYDSPAIALLRMLYYDVHDEDEDDASPRLSPGYDGSRTRTDTVARLGSIKRPRTECAATKCAATTTMTTVAAKTTTNNNSSNPAITTTDVVVDDDDDAARNKNHNHEDNDGNTKIDNNHDKSDDPDLDHPNNECEQHSHSHSHSHLELCMHQIRDLRSMYLFGLHTVSTLSSLRDAPDAILPPLQQRRLPSPSPLPPK